MECRTEWTTDSEVEQREVSQGFTALAQVAPDLSGPMSRAICCFVTSGDNHAHGLTRLVQHVALNESGWWEQAIERLVLACAYTQAHSSREKLRTLVVELCGVQPNSERVDSTMERLVASGALVEYDGMLRVSEETREALEQQESATLDSEGRVRARFEDLVRKRDLHDQVDELWQVMETEVVLPVVRHLGARMYELLTAHSSAGSGDLESQMHDFLTRHGDQVRAFMADFLDPGDHDVRRFVLRRLNAQYAVDAAALPLDALAKLSRLEHKASRVDVFLDTNFLFSVLGLHENPSDDAANDLLQLVRELKGRVDLKLYVIPETVEEARRVLRDAIARLGDFRGQRNLAEAARRTTASGLTARYFEAARTAVTLLTAEEFFGPYESDLVTVLRSKGVELYNKDLSRFHSNQEVVDDLHGQAERQEQFRQRGAKTYEANLHDMVLWHFTRSRRGVVMESPLGVTAWVATLDRGLIKFDRDKRRGTSDPPVCLEPSSLILLFQFWVPSSAELDEALVGSVRQPLLFLAFDEQSEQVTLRILNQLSRFEGAGDLEIDVASEILTNQALRNRLAGTANDDTADKEIVREELVHVVQQLGEKIACLQSERTEAHDAIARLNERVSAAEANTEADKERKARLKAEQAHATEKASRGQAEKEKQLLAGEVAGLESRLTDLESKNNELEQSLENRDQEAAARRENWRFGGLGAATVALSVTVLVVAGTVLDPWLKPAVAWVAGVAAGLLILLIGLELATRGTRYEKSRLTMQASSLRRWELAFLLTVATSVITDLILLD